MNSIYQAIAELEKNNGSAALCTVTSSEGSTPRHVGSKMLVYPDGKFIGTVGGGFTSLPLMFHEVISRGWMSTTTFLDGVALGQVTPGPVILTATFVGLAVAGYPGAAVATIAIFLPSFLILVGVAPHVSRLRAWRRFDALVAGLSASFVGLLATTTVRFATEVPWDPSRLVTTGVAFGVLGAGIALGWVVRVGAAGAPGLIAP